MEENFAFVSVHGGVQFILQSNISSSDEYTAGK